MDDIVFIGDGGLHEIVMVEFNRVRVDVQFGGGVNDLKTAIIVEGWANVEATQPR